MKTRKITLYLIPFLIFSFFIFCFVTDAPVFRWLEFKSIDWRFHWRGPIPASGQVVIVALDEKSIVQEGRWPWPRRKIASLVQKINEAGAEFVEMDIIFSEPSSEDELLAKALQFKKNVTLGYYFYQSEHEKEKAEISPENVEKSYQTILPTALPNVSDLKSDLYQMVGVTSNLPSLAKAALTQGYFNARPDADGVIRRFPLMVSYKDRIFPSMTLKTVSNFRKGFDPVPVRDERGKLNGVSLGSDLIPTNSRGEVIINYRGLQEQFPVYSATDFLQGKVAPNSLKGKIVLVGATAIGIYDLRVTPYSPNLPGILVQANFLDTILKGDFLVYDQDTLLIALAWMLITSIFLVLLIPHIRMTHSLFITIVLSGMYVFGLNHYFKQNQIIPLVIPTLNLISIAVAMLLYRGLTEERDKKAIRSAFQSYLHPDLVKEMMDNPGALKLGGQRRECTILFSDVRNFTSISEKMDPQVLVTLMNEYFDPISQVIIAEGGYIDKFIGDAVMVIFGAPKATETHAEQACRTAIRMVAKVKELEPIFKEKFNIEAFKIGIGIHTGEVIVGNIGTQKRLNYTVMGDTVNLASRLESATKELGATACMSESTFQKVGDHIKSRYLSEISVKGKEIKVRVYEILGL